MEDNYILKLTIVKPKQAGTCGRSIRNELMSNTNIKCYGTNSIYLLSRLYAILYCPSQRKQHVYGNLASWLMVQAPPTTASLFWFYYSYFSPIQRQSREPNGPKGCPWMDCNLGK